MGYFEGTKDIETRYDFKHLFSAKIHMNIIRKICIMFNKDDDDSPIALTISPRAVMTWF